MTTFFAIGAAISLSAAGAVQAGKNAPAAEEIEEVVDVTDVSTISVWSAESWRDPAQFPALDRVINLYSTATIPEWRGSFVVDHRAFEPLKDKPFDDFLGFDAGSLKIGLGLRLGILDNLDAGIFRLNGTVEPFDTYEFDARLRFLSQERHMLNAALRAGVTWFYVPSAADDSGVFGQVLIDRLFARRVLLGASLLYHSNSSNDEKTAADTRWSLAAGTLLSVRMTRFLSWDIEGVFAAAGYRSAHPQLSTAARFITNRHTFSIVFSTTQYITADGIVTNTGRGLDETVFGFKIARELP